MGLYDNYILPSSGKYISTYAGKPIQELAALGKTIGAAYEQGVGGVSAYNVMRDKTQVSEVDQAIKDEAFDGSYKKIKKFVEDGNYEDANPAIIQAATMVSGNKKLRKAMSNRTSLAEHRELADELLSTQKIDKDQYSLMLRKLSEYEGVNSEGNINSNLYIPSKPINVYDKFVDAAKTVGKTKGVVNRVRDEDTGTMIDITREQRNQEDVLLAIQSAQNDPEFIGYYRDLVEMYGQENADEMVQRDAMAAFKAATAASDTNKYNKFAKTTGGDNDPSYDDPVYSYLEIESNTKDALNLDLKTDDFDYDLGEGSDLEKDTRKGEQIAARNKQNFTGMFSGLGDIVTSVEKTLRGIPDEEDIKVFKEYEIATKNYNGLSDEEWGQLTNDQKTDLGETYLKEQGSRKQSLGVKNISESEARSFNFVGDTANPSQSVILKGATDSVNRNIGNMDFINTEGGDSFSATDIRNYINEGYELTVVGQSDSKNPYAKENGKFADSFVIKLINPDNGKTKTLLGTKPNSYYEDQSSIMTNYGVPASNEDYSVLVSNFNNTFSTVSYPETVSYGDVDIKGSRSKNTKTIDVNELVIGGVSYDLEEIATGLNLPYQDGVMYGLTDEMLSQLTMRWNYSYNNPPKK